MGCCATEAERPNAEKGVSSPEERLCRNPVMLHRKPWYFLPGPAAVPITRVIPIPVSAHIIHKPAAASPLWQQPGKDEPPQ